ncbi:MAG TPA: RidA family protein [Kofleriaceae bacterium]|nr:RidA family protein [Kofleriaceae bacterium]
MKRESLNPDTLSAPRGYSHVTVVTSARQVHVSGQVALNAAGEVIGKGDLAAQTEQVYKNLGHALAAAGAQLSDVFKLVTYVVGLDPEKLGVVRTVRTRFLGDGPHPASTLVGVTALVHPDLLIEIEAIAALE